MSVAKKQNEQICWACLPDDVLVVRTVLYQSSIFGFDLTKFATRRKSSCRYIEIMNPPPTMEQRLAEDQVNILRNKVARSIARRSGSIGRRSGHKRRSRQCKSLSSDGSISVLTSESWRESYLDDTSTTFQGDSSNTSDSHNSFAGCEPIEEDIIKLTINVPVLHFGEYRTINQNEFFKECMITDCEGSAVVHFFDENDPASIELDLLLRQLAAKYTSCKFLRIDGKNSNFVCSKLSIESFPTVLAIRNKVILDRSIGFDGMPADFEKWILDSIPFISETKKVIAAQGA